MGMESLNKAANAAGYAMAPAEEMVPDSTSRSETAAAAFVRPQVANLPALPAARQATGVQWVRGFFALLGRGQPA